MRKEYREKSKNKIGQLYNSVVHQILALYAVLILSYQRGNRGVRNCWTQNGYSEHGIAVKLENASELGFFFKKTVENQELHEQSVEITRTQILVHLYCKH